MITNKSKIDLISSFLLLVISIVALWETRGLSEMSYIFPRTVCIILFIMSLVYFFKSLVEKEGMEYFKNVSKRKVILIASGMAGYVILISFIGFLTASIIYLTSSIWILQKGRSIKSNRLLLIHSLFISIILSSALYVLFRYVLIVPLPDGLLGL